MKNLILTSLLMLLLLSSTNTQAQNSTTSKPEKNFFQVRDEILKELEKAKEENLINEEEKENDDAMAKFKRWENFMLPRVGPTGDFFKPDAVFNEYQRYFGNQANKFLSANNPWQAVGPYTDISDVTHTIKVGVGRINCLVQHPTDSNTLYIGTFGGGIWKTTNGGLQWTSLNDNLPAMSFSDIAINPIHPDTIFAASGDMAMVWNSIMPSWNFNGQYSAGILMSPDGGLTWSQTGLTYQQYQMGIIFRVVVDPVNTNNILTATYNGLYRSTDAGATWNQLDSTICFDIQINPLDPNKYYAVTNNGVKVKRSYDGGATWVYANSTPLGSVGRTYLRISAADTNSIFAIRNNGRLLKSTNGGSTFPIVSIPGNTFDHQNDYDMALAISPLTTNNILLGLVALIKSTDGGNTFNYIDSTFSYDYGIHADFHAVQFANGNPNKVYATNDGGVYVSYDEGESWTSLNNGLNIMQYYKMNSSYLNPDLLLGGSQDNSSHLYDGSDWKMVLGWDGMDCSFDRTDENIAYASKQGGLVYRSEDGGNSFGKLISPNGFVGAWETPHLINPINGHTIFLAAKSVLISYNRGDNWQSFSPVLDSQYYILTLAQSRSDTSTMYAATYGRIFSTTDYGTTWSEITAGLPMSSSAISDVKVNEQNAQIVYVTISGFSAGNKVFKSIDGGLTWINISGTLPNIPCNTILIQKNTVQNDLYVGTDFGVFYFNDSIADWIPYSNSLPGVIVSDLDLNYRSGKLYAATQGRGIYKVDPINPVMSINNDAAIAQVIAPTVGDYCDSLTSPVVFKIKNFGVDTLTSVTINYTIDNGPVNSVAWSGQLPTGTYALDTVATLTFNAGNHIINAYTSNPNGTADDEPLNDAQQFAFNINTTVTSTPFAEGFENSFPPADWYYDNNPLWSQATVGAYNASTKSLRANFYDVPAGVGNLTSMRIDLSNLPPKYVMSFAHAYAMVTATFVDTLVISVSSDCGNNWNVVYSKSDTALTTVAGFVTNPFVPTANEWVTEYVDLSAYAGLNIKVRFEAHAGYGNYLYIDDINIFHGTVGIEENNLNQVQVFPNPATNHVTFALGSNNKNVEVTIADITGKIIYTTIARDMQKVEVNTQDFAAGIYVVQIQTADFIATKKLVVEK